MNSNNNTEKILIDNLIEQLTNLNKNINELEKNIKNMKSTSKPYDNFNVVMVCGTCLAIVSMLFVKQNK